MPRRGFGLCGALLLALTPATAVTQQDTESAAIESALPNLVDRGAGLFLLAERQAAAGNLTRALTLLEECVGLDEGFDPRTAAAFEPLRSMPAFRALADRVERRFPAVHRARIAFTIPDPELFPEGIAADPALHLFYVGSMHEKKIVRIDAGGAVSDLVKAGMYGLKPVGGIKVDPADHSVWAATDSAEFVHVDRNGALLGRYTATEEGPHILNDLVLRGDREIYVTDTRGHHVYRFDRASSTFSTLPFDRRLFYPNGITLSTDGSVLYVADLLGVIRVDLRTLDEQDVEPGRGNTLAGIDGLYFYDNSLVAVQYGTGAFRVVRCRLSADGQRVASTDVLERGTALVSSTTTGAIVGSDLYFIANTGIPNLVDDKIVDRRKLEPVHIAVVPLGQ
jgi:hypothetical protein